MDYVYFVFCVAVFASIFGLCWRRYAIRVKSNGNGAAGRAAAPTPKAALGGMSGLETRRVELPGSIDAWQRARAGRLDRFETKEQPPVSGEKYVFEPPKESRARALRHRSSVAGLRQRFELIG